MLARLVDEKKEEMVETWCVVYFRFLIHSGHNYSSVEIESSYVTKVGAYTLCTTQYVGIDIYLKFHIIIVIVIVCRMNVSLCLWSGWLNVFISIAKLRARRTDRRMMHERRGLHHCVLRCIIAVCTI